MAWRDAFAYNMAPPQFTPLQAPDITQPRIIRPPLAQPPPGGGGVIQFTGGGGTEPRLPAQPPERFKFSLPVSTTPPGVVEIEGYRPADETQGDIVASFGQSIQDITRTNNLGSITGSIYEAPAGLAIEASRYSAVPIFGALGPQLTKSIADGVFGALGEGAKVLEGIANTVKDTWRNEELKSRSINYAKLVTSTATQFKLVTYDDPLEKTKKIIAALTGTTYDQQRAITMAAWDLPDDVKQALDRDPLIAFDPNKLDRLLTQTLDREDGPGRRWTYTDSPYASALNYGPDIGIDILLLYATGGLAGVGRAIGLPAAKVAGAAGRASIGGEIGIARAIPGARTLVQQAARVPGLPTVSRVATKGTSAAIQLNKQWVRLGMGTMAVTSVLDGIARTVGNEEALEFANNVFNYAPFSENPAVMYISSFTVNPLAGLAHARRGVVSVWHGANVVVGKVTGNRIASIWSTEERLERMFGEVYGYNLASVPDAIERHFDGRRGVVMDHMMNLASQDVLDRVPREIAAVIQAAYKDIRRQEQVLREYGPQILDVLESKEGLERLRLAVQDNWHNYRGNLEVYDPDQALMLGADYGQTKLNTFELRNENNVVLGYPKFLVPVATQELRRVVAEVAGDAIPARLLDQFGRLYGGWTRYAPLAKPHIAGKAGSRTVPRAVMDDIIKRAEEDYRLAAIQHPVRVRTGRDPILRSDSPMREWAEAFGTDAATIRVARNPTGNIVQDAATLRPFVMAKREVLPEGPFSEAQVRAMADDEVYIRAVEYVEEASQPWVKMGKEVEAAEAQANVLRSRHAEAVVGHRPDEAKELAGRLAKLEETIREASGPIVPFSATLTAAMRAAPDISSHSMMAAARRKVDAQSRLSEIDAIKDGLRSTFQDVEVALSRIHRNRAGAWTYDTSSPVPLRLQSKLLRFLRNTSDNRIDDLSERNRAEIWKLVRKYVVETTDRNGKKLKLNQAEDEAFRNAVIGSDDIQDALLGNARTAGMDPSEVLDELVAAKLAIDSLLERRPEAVLRRTANAAAIPKPYEEAALSELQFVKNYIAEVDTIPARTTQVREALAHPEDPVVYGEAERIIIESDILANRLFHLAKGRDFSDWLRDPANADTILAALPEGDVPLTPLDEALINAVAVGGVEGRRLMDAALDEIAFQQTAYPNLVKRKPPIKNVTLEQAEDIAAGLAPRAAGADGGLGANAAYQAAKQRIAELELELGAAKLDGPPLAGADPDLNRLLAEAAAEVTEFERRWNVLAAGGRLGPDEVYDAVAHSTAEARLASFTAAKAAATTIDLAAAPKSAYDAAIRRARAGRPVAHPVTGEMMPGDIATVQTLRSQRKLATTARTAGPAPAAPVSPEVTRIQAELKAARKVVRDAESTAAAKAAKAEPRKRLPRGRSWVLLDALRKAGADMSILPSRSHLAKNKVGAEVMSLIVWGIPGRLPNQLSDVVVVLREIENGNAANLGFGPKALAEAQKLGDEILEYHLKYARVAFLEKGIATAGAQPENWSARDQDSLMHMIANGVVEEGALGIQYGVKKLPEGEIQLEMEEARRIADEYGIATLAEELFRGRFQPYQSRIFEAQTKRAFNFIFGPESMLHFLSPEGTTNNTVYARARSRFVTGAVNKGASAQEAERMWAAFSDYARDSNFRRAVRDKKTKEWTTVPGGTAVFMTPNNIPNGDILWVAQDVLKTMNDGVVPAHLRTVAWQDVFREASGPIMRLVGSLPGPLGPKLQRAYGNVRYHPWITTMYYLFRFGTDVRYHAMNYFEGNMLYYGRAALRPGELDRGLIGMSRERLQRIGDNPYADAGMPFSRDRAEIAYRAFLKEQPDALRDEIRRFQAEDPDALKRAFEELAANDPELSKTIAAFGDTPQGWMVLMDQYHDRIMNSIDIDGEFNEEFARLMAAEPAMAEVYGHLNRVNQELWADVKATFFGNPSRSNLERTMNSWLLYWPLTYQIKSAKWLLRVMFDRMGGLPTNSYGAYSLDQIAADHNRLMATDPEYAQWILDHPTLIFAAQSLIPISPFDFGLSLNPLVRNVFFPETSKKVMEIGPVYTWSSFVPQLVGELYPTLHDVPGMDLVYKSTVGRQAPKNVRGTGVPSGGGGQVPSIFGP